MKKILLVLTFISLFGFAKAQTDSDDNLGFRFGLQFSPEMGWMKAQDKTANSSSPKFGFAYGLMFDYNFNKRYAFSTGIYVTQLSSELTYNVDTNGIKFNSFKDLTFYTGAKQKFNKLQYIEIPISIKLKTNEIGYITYFGQFGFQGGLNFRAKGDISDNNGNHNKVDENINPDVSLGNVALLVGGGLEYSLSSSTSAYVSLNFVNGFLDVTDNPKGYKSKVALNQLALRLGIFF